MVVAIKQREYFLLLLSSFKESISCKIKLIFVLLDTVRVFRTVRVWYIPYAYTRTVQPYAYGMAICTIWVSTIFSLFSYILTQYCLIFVLDLYFHRSTPYAVFCRVMFLHSPL